MMDLSEVRTVAESVARYAEWVAAGEPAHTYTERGQVYDYCRECGLTLSAMPHLADPTRMQGHEALYAAEELIRADHKIIDPAWRFWGGVADYLNSWASRGKDGLVRTPREIRDFNSAVAIAYGYEATRGAS